MGQRLSGDCEAVLAELKFEPEPWDAAAARAVAHTGLKRRQVGQHLRRLRGAGKVRTEWVEGVMCVWREKGVS